MSPLCEACGCQAWPVEIACQVQVSCSHLPARGKSVLHPCLKKSNIKPLDNSQFTRSYYRHSYKCDYNDVLCKQHLWMLIKTNVATQCYSLKEVNIICIFICRWTPAGCSHVKPGTDPKLQVCFFSLTLLCIEKEFTDILHFPPTIYAKELDKQVKWTQVKEKGNISITISKEMRVVSSWWYHTKIVLSD